MTEESPDVIEPEAMRVLRERLDLREKQLSTVYRVSAALYSQKDLESLLRQTLNVSLETVDADAGSLLLYDRDKDRLIFSHVEGPADLRGREVDPNDPSAKVSLVYRSGQSLLISDTIEAGYDRTFDQETGYQTRTMLTVPLIVHGGQTIGVMQALNKRHKQFDLDDQALLETVCSMAATAIVSAQLYEEAQLAAVARAVGDLSHDIKNHLTPIETTMQTTVSAFIVPMYEDLDRMQQEPSASPPEILAAVKLATEPLREWYPDAEMAVHYGCTDIREMVSEIADYVKGTQSSNLIVSNLKEIVEERLERLKMLARQRYVTLHTENMESVPPFAFDQRLLGRALYNLVNNALGALDDAVKRKVMELRPFNVWIRATAVVEGEFPNGGYCLIEVMDDGPGIPTRIRDLLFTPLAMSTTPGGTGIGTRFVKSVANAHHGQVGVESELGHGARIWMKLPLKQPETAQDSG